MCRLYGFCATEPTKVECTLVHAQNALLAQSENDASGKSHSEGWGVATFSDGKPELEKQAWAAYDGEHFKRKAANVYAKTVIAHVRRATVGQPSLLNTHPFVAGNWAFAHNGTVPKFKQILPQFLEQIAPHHRQDIKGETDSEHVFAYIRTLMDRSDNKRISEILRESALHIESLVHEHDPHAKLGLNIMLTNGKAIYGTRLGRTLYYVKRPGVYDCQICGFPHIHHDPNTNYWANVVASEPITDEKWSIMPERSIWEAAPLSQSLSIEDL